MLQMANAARTGRRTPTGLPVGRRIPDEAFALRGGREGGAGGRKGGRDETIHAGVVEVEFADAGRLRFYGLEVPDGFFEGLYAL